MQKRSDFPHKSTTKRVENRRQYDETISIGIFLAQKQLNFLKNKKNTTQNPESLLTLSTNFRIMISTPTAINTVEKK
ncbi:CLUMA_CG021095, isoform A [Clunio marinus]|uniref:CLUMA_CG021095, isoform A n=1 Tax=Clunio marinus TaxID=568069 RepID=A0A1J1J6B5_9DIPT|nr:CLUMA_CG021095, isoform A [Clunio marinus]